jgi:hypothetical protein
MNEEDVIGVIMSSILQPFFVVKFCVRMVLALIPAFYS